jgi:hypothetical protein
MRARLLLICILTLGVSGLAQADPIVYNVNGSGGLSQPVPGYSNSSFAWIDDTGNIAGSALSAYGFDTNPFVAQESSFFSNVSSGVLSTVFADTLVPYGVGSLLSSGPISLNAGDTLNVNFSVLTTTQFVLGSVGFAVLLKDGTIDAVLAAVDARGGSTFESLTHPVSANFPVSAPEVNAVLDTSRPPVEMTLGTTDYNGSKTNIFQCDPALRNCETDVLTSYVPGAGTYQLLFGVFQVGLDDSRGPSALAVTSVNVQPVPEPATVGLITLSLLGIGLLRRHCRA